jgi:hypothetical protein
LVCPTHHFDLVESYGGRNLNDRFGQWRNVFEFYLGVAMLASGGIRFDSLSFERETFFSETIYDVGQMFYGSAILAIPYQTGQGMGHAKELILRDPADSQNVFR